MDGTFKRNPKAGWYIKNDSRHRKKSTYVFSIHTGVDEDGFIHCQQVAPGNVHDSQERDTLILSDENALYADAAYSSKDTGITHYGLARTRFMGLAKNAAVYGLPEPGYAEWVHLKSLCKTGSGELKLGVTIYYSEQVQQNSC